MFNDLINNRRSIRCFKEEKVKANEIEEILRSGLFAPSGMNQNPCEFLVLENDEDIKKASLAKTDEYSFISKGSHIIILLINKECTASTHEEDSAIASSFIQLKASELGIGTCWIQLRGRKKPSGQASDDYLRGLFNIPEKFDIFQMLVLGYPNEDKGEKIPTNYDERVHFNRY